MIVMRSSNGIKDRLRELHGTRLEQERGGWTPYAEAKALLWALGFDEPDPTEGSGVTPRGRVDVSEYIDVRQPMEDYDIDTWTEEDGTEVTEITDADGDPVWRQTIWDRGHDLPDLTTTIALMQRVADSEGVGEAFHAAGEAVANAVAEKDQDSDD